MAVIITNMDMPKSCIDCKGINCSLPFSKNSKHDVILKKFREQRHKNCPLKSTGEMCTEIQDVYVGYRHGYEVMHDVLNIINKYCKENTDDT